MLFLALFLNITAEAAENKPFVGIAWREGSGETFEAVCRAIEAAGGIPIDLNQIRSADLEYTEDGTMIRFKDKNGALTFAKIASPSISCGNEESYKQSNLLPLPRQ